MTDDTAEDPLDMRSEADIVRAALRARIVETHTTGTSCLDVALDGPIAALVALIWCATSDIAKLRTHSALGMLTPAEYADQWANNNPKKLS